MFFKVKTNIYYIMAWKRRSKKLNVDPFNIMRYDLLESKSEDILEDMQTISFFSEQKNYCDKKHPVIRQRGR